MTTSTRSDYEATALEHFERIWQRDLSVVDLYTDDVVWISTGLPRIEGKECVRAHLKGRLENFPHLKAPTIEHVSSKGSTVVVVLEATFAEGVVRAAEVFEFEDGKIRSNSIYFQNLGGEGFGEDMMVNLTHQADS
jgi:ketosteroid isomerase-like protein